MQAMILAAGRGERMRPLTDATPKALLKIGEYSLIEHHLIALRNAGIDKIVINVAHLGQQIMALLDNGSRYQVTIHYSNEGEHALETAGGIIHALPLLDDKPFIVINADIWTNYLFKKLPSDINGLAHLVMVDNPPQHPAGDFYLTHNMLNPNSGQKLTYSGIGVYNPLLFKNITPGKQPLLPILQRAIQKKAVSGEHYKGIWQDIGTPERLEQLNKQLNGL